MNNPGLARIILRVECLSHYRVGGQNSCHCMGQNSWRAVNGPELMARGLTRDTTAPA